MRKYKLLTTAMMVAMSQSSFAVLQNPGSGNGYGQTCPGQKSYGVGPCYPTAYIPTFSSGIGAGNQFTFGVQPD